MVRKTKQNINQYDVESLANLLEDWLALSCQMQIIQENLNHLPTEIATLRQLSQAELSQTEVNAKMQFILHSLNAQLPKLFKLEEKVNNSISRREIIEALQQKIKGNYNDYEINFARAKLNCDRLRNKNKVRGFSTQKSISQRFANFWDKNYFKISIGIGITTIASYSLFLYLSSQNQTKININYTESKVEQLY